MSTQTLKRFPATRDDGDLGDRWLLGAVVGLVLFGVVMVYSASAMTARVNYHNQFYFLWRQGFAAVVGIGLLFAALWVGYERLNRPAMVYGLLGVSALLLFVVLFLPPTRNTHRFIRVAGFSFQPSELAKIALVVFIAHFLSKRTDEEIRGFRWTFLPSVAVSGSLMLLVLLGKDLGTVFVMAMVLAAMSFAGGVPLRFPLLGAVAALPILIFEVVRAPYRLERLRAYLNPWEFAQKEGFQVVQSLIAVGSGGVQGLGLSQGKQKLFYLPEAHTDFIFAVVGEELGLIGAATVVFTFGFLGWRGLRAGWKAPDRFGMLLATGLTVMLVGQAFFNISVVLGLVPNKGLPLPFLSYGGSSVMMSLFAVGILLSVSRGEKYAVDMNSRRLKKEKF